MSKALQVFTCVFTDLPPNAGTVYSPDTLPATERNMYNAVKTAYAGIVAAEGSAPLVQSMCFAADPQFQAFLSQANTTLPFIAIMGTFAGGEKRYYVTKSITQVAQYIQAMYAGEFGGTGLPTNPGDGDGGWGQGNAIICQILPPLCALGFLPWLALAAFTTYRTAEARSGIGKAAWGIPAFLFWQGFLARGGVKQIQYWIKKL